MGVKWYYAENGERRGPATSEEIVKLVEREGAQRVLIWAERIQVTASSPADEEWRR